MKVRCVSLLLGVACLPLALATGCAKAPTRIDVQVQVDSTVPELLVLRSTVVRDSDPMNRALEDIVSGAPSGDDAGRPGAFQFPLLVRVKVPPAWSGPVTVTIEGIDWDTNQVNATGTTEANAISEQTTTATVMMRGVVIGGSGDAGTGADGGATDAGDGG